jgi:hypothetical protein
VPVAPTAAALATFSSTAGVSSTLRQ